MLFINAGVTRSERMTYGVTMPPVFGGFVTQNPPFCRVEILANINAKKREKKERNKERKERESDCDAARMREKEREE